MKTASLTAMDFSWTRIEEGRRRRAESHRQRALAFQLHKYSRFEMPSTPLKAVGIRGNENTPEPAGSVKKTPGSQKKDLWSRSSASRFSGHGSIYNATAGLAPLSNTTPSKQQSSSLSQRYATPAERMAGSTPTRALSSTAYERGERSDQNKPPVL